MVDRPANQMPFLFIKRADAEGGIESELAKKFSGLDVTFKTDGTYGGTSLQVNGKNVPDCTAFTLNAYPKPVEHDALVAQGMARSPVPEDDAEMGLYCSYSQANKAETNGGFYGSFNYCLQKGDAADMADISKPYPNEHAARMTDPGQYKAIRRQNNKMGPGIHAIFGVKEDGKTELQAIRFDKAKFTAEEAKKWLADHDMKPMMFEPAVGRVKKVAEADAAAVTALTGEDVGDTDGEVLAELAKSIATVELYKAALPPDLVAAVADIAKLACECELVEVDTEVAKMADTVVTPADAPAVPPVDVKAIAEAAAQAAITAALPQVVKAVMEAMRPAVPAVSALESKPAVVEDPEVTPEEMKQLTEAALKEALKT